MEVGNDARNRGVKQLQSVQPINVKSMEVGNDARNRGVNQVQKVQPINALHMEVGNDARNRGVQQVHEVQPINALHMEVGNDARIALIGQTVVVVQPLTMVIVPRVSNIYFQTMNAVKLYMRIQKK
jgi:hypothetical protein